MQSTIVMLALFMVAFCVINSIAATTDDVSQNVDAAKLGDDGGKEILPSIGSFNIFEFIEQIKPKTDVTKILGVLFGKAKE